MPFRPTALCFCVSLALTVPGVVWSAPRTASWDRLVPDATPHHGSAHGASPTATGQTTPETEQEQGEDRSGTAPLTIDCSASLSPYRLLMAYEEPNKDAILACFDAADEAGEFVYNHDSVVSVRFWLSPEGTASDFEIREPQFRGTELADCLIEIVETTEYGPTDCFRPKQVSYPFRPSIRHWERRKEQREKPSEMPGEPPELDLPAR